MLLMKKKIKTLVAELGALFLLTLVLTTPTLPGTLPTIPPITDGIDVENPEDAMQTNADDPDRPSDEPNFGRL